METAGRYIFKRAETGREIEQVHRLNYRTFVREIPQHKDPGSGVLVDKFHDKNHYFIALSGDRVIGMVSVHDRPPFSAAERLPDPRALERPGMRPLEVRLLAIEPDARLGKIFAGLLWQVVEHARAGGHSHLLISGLAERQEMYRRLGFSPLGPPVRSGSAQFIPMIADVRGFPQNIERDIRRWGQYQCGLARTGASGEGSGDGPLCLTPGPVRVAPAVREAFALPPLYHRGREFLRLFRDVRRALAELAGGLAGGRAGGRVDVALLNGSGTLANDAVAAALAAEREPTPGVVISNGEFGDRLVRHAERAGLRFRTLRFEWGKPWRQEEIAAALRAKPAPGWVWGVQLESSTGVLNDIGGLMETARREGARVVLDCVSGLGAAPVDLSGVHLATGVSGKSLGAYAGIAVVFAGPGALKTVASGKLLPSLDLKAALALEGPLHTFPSPPLMALEAALEAYSGALRAAEVYRRRAAQGRFVRERLREIGLEPLSGERWASPVITTFHPPGGAGSEDFVDRCRALGFEIGGRSGYLAERRLVQIATMGDVDESDCAPLFERLR